MTNTDRFRNSLKRLAVMGALSAAAAVGLAACGGTTDAQPTPTATVAPAAVAPTAPIAVATRASDVTPPTVTVVAGSDIVVPTPGGLDTGPGAVTQSTPAASNNAGTVTAVQGTLVEWGINLSTKEVPAGTVTFSVTNQGRMPHNFTITDGTNAIKGTPTFSSSEGTQTLTVDLKPGTYTIICSLPGHAQRGQKTELVVK